MNLLQEDTDPMLLRVRTIRAMKPQFRSIGDLLDLAIYDKSPGNQVTGNLIELKIRDVMSQLYEETEHKAKQALTISQENEARL